MKIGFFISIGINLLLILILFYVMCLKTDYAQRVVAKITGDVYVPVREDQNCVQSWNNTMEQLDYDADAVFFGNSITAGNNWQMAFPNKRVVNLGYIGEDAKGMIRRVNAIAAVQPEKIFLMAGINGLKNQNLDDFAIIYAALVDSILCAVPNATLYIESILPVTRSSMFCPNSKIQEANQIIQQIAADRGLIYIDLYAIYASDGTLPEDWSYDGLHLLPQAYNAWVNAISQYINE